MRKSGFFTTEEMRKSGKYREWMSEDGGRMFVCSAGF